MSRASAGRLGLALAGLTLAFSSAWADEDHYKGLPIGERATGLGGAFTAISDDPSGLYYNPAGIVWGFENYLSLSANAYNSSRKTYKRVVAGQDYTISSADIVPVFFGFTQNMGKGKLGFAVIVVNSDLEDQDDTISNITDEVGGEGRLKRRYLQQNQTYLIGPGYAREIYENLSVGLSAFAHYQTQKGIDNQILLYNPVPDGAYYHLFTHIRRMTIAVQPRLGVQWMPSPKLSLGLMVAKPFKIKSTLYREERTSKMDRTDPAKPVPAPVDGSFLNDVAESKTEFSDFPMIDPWQFTFGAAWFYSKKFLVSSDIDYYTSDRDFGHRSVMNASIGAEWYVRDQMPIRLGFFTDLSNKYPTTGATIQATSVSLIGVASGISWMLPGSSFTLGGNYAWGSGKGSITANNAAKDVSQSMFNVLIMGSYQL